MTREEALKIVRENYPHFGTTEPWLDLEKALATLIPELRESEDESIRKWIASYIHHGVFTEDEHPMALKAVEWLEKQKYDRMKPIYDAKESFESALEKAWKSYNDSGARTVDGCEDDYVECAHAKGFREGFLYGLEKQKEQKPLSTEETELNSIAFLEQMGYTCIPPKKEHQNNSDAPKNALGGADAVEGEVIVPIYEGDDTWSAEIKIPGTYNIGDKVRIVVLKEEE